MEESKSLPEFRDDLFAIMKIEAGKRYVVFADPTRVDFEALEGAFQGTADIWLVPAIPPRGGRVSDYVAVKECPPGTRVETTEELAGYRSDASGNLIIGKPTVSKA